MLNFHPEVCKKVDVLRQKIIKVWRKITSNVVKVSKQELIDVYNEVKKVKETLLVE